MKNLVLLFSILLFQGCTYAISSEYTSQVDKTITFPMILADPDTCKGKLVILGGTIADITREDRGTILEIVEKPLDYWGKPKRTNASGGRFLALSTGHLDVMAYAPGRQITVAAEIAGTRSGALGETAYSYPLVYVKQIKLWEPDRPSWGTPQWIDPLSDFYNPSRPQ